MHKIGLLSPQNGQETVNQTYECENCGSKDVTRFFFRENAILEICRTCRAVFIDDSLPIDYIVVSGSIGTQGTREIKDFIERRHKIASLNEQKGETT